MLFIEADQYCSPKNVTKTTHTHTHTHTQPFYCSSRICLGPPRWAGTRKAKPSRL